MRRFASITFAVAIIAIMATGASAALKLPAMFTDGGVLQQGMSVPVWGWGDAGSEVTVAFAGQTKTAKVGEDGKWIVKLDALKKNNEPADMTIKMGDETLEVSDVLVGEVWFCSGQSNMEWTVGGAILPEHVKPDDFPNIRHIKVPHVRAGEPADDFNGAWQTCSAQTVRGFTAVGFFFAYTLDGELDDTPIGLIGCNWGGTRIEPWTPPEGFDLVPELDSEKLGDKSSMFNGMVKAVQPYAIKGAIWYQGESNGGEGETYFQKKKAMVLGWRKTWDQGEFPFYLVQLANFRAATDTPGGGDGWARLRESQLKAVRQIPKVGMAVITDIGEERDIHPRNKYDVGRRLALWALANDYGKDLVYSGPLYKSMKVEGDKIRVSFDHTGTGLIAAKKDNPQSIDPPAPAEKLEGFAVAGEDKVFYWADAVIDGDTVVVSADEVKAPVAVRYGFRMNPIKINLYNKENLPASPFRTDAW